MVSMPAFFRFCPVFRGVCEFTTATSRSSFLWPRHYLGYGIGGDLASLGRFSLFLRFSAALG